MNILICGTDLNQSQQSQFVGGKTFFQNDKQWIDSAIQKHPDAKRIRIQFGSPEYFDLLAKNEKVLQWLALGQNIQFILDKTILRDLRITETEGPVPGSTSVFSVFSLGLKTSRHTAANGIANAFYVEELRG